LLALIIKKNWLSLVAKLGNLKFGCSNAQKHFNYFLRKINHLMGYGLISTIDLIIEFLKFLPKNILVIV
jgi:hypothetical protein